MTIETIVGNRWHLGGGKMANILIPKSEPATVRDDKALLVRCEFELLNFPSMWGKKDVHCYPAPTNTTSSLVYPRFQLEMKPWFIDVFATDSLQGIHYNLMRRGGSAITHTGTITRVDGQKFCLYELDRLLAALHLFLSFARGSYCGLTRLSGYDSDGNLVWEQWGTYQVEPWRRELPTWVDGLSNHTLSPVFMGLWRLLSDPRRSDTISKVIHWYIRSNERSEPEISVVLTHAALERLSFDTMGPRGERKEGNWMAETLLKNGIDPSVPMSCQELTRLQKQKGWWYHGPHALVDIRNDLVHPENRKGPFSEAALLDAQNLGLHYVELMLLRLSCYSGQYVNRLTSKVETVPWSHL